MDNRKPQSEKEEVIDYTFRRKVIYKGKMAPAGHIYLVIKFTKEKKVWEACKLVKGGQGEDFEKSVCKVIRKQMFDKYGI